MNDEARLKEYDAQHQLLEALAGPNFGDRPACRDEDPELFFPVSEEHRSQIERAKTVCRSCPVRRACLEFALRSGDDGIWGATTIGERRAMRRTAVERRTEDGDEVAA